jgi:hypothetical protein
VKKRRAEESAQTAKRDCLNAIKSETVADTIERHEQHRSYTLVRGDEKVASSRAVGCVTIHVWEIEKDL